MDDEKSAGMDEASSRRLEEAVAAAAKKVASLAGRAAAMNRQNRLSEVQAEAGALGLGLLRAVGYAFGLGGPGMRDRIAAAARRLRAVELERVYSDGSQSTIKILEAVSAANALLQGAVADLQKA